MTSTGIEPSDLEFGRSLRPLSGRSISSITGHQIVKEAVVPFKKLLPPGHLPVDWNGDGKGTFISIPTKHRLAPTEKRPLKVCIVGAGAAGMRIAMFFDYLKVDYDILEASDRHGGRAFTHHFSRADYDYYDVGAMRFPRTRALQQTFTLFDELQLTADPGGGIINYVMSIPTNIQLFNGFRTTNAQAMIADDPHSDQPHIPLGCLTFVFNVGARHFKGAAAISAAAMEPLKQGLAANFQVGWVALMAQDHLTTREFMRNYLVNNDLVPADQPRQQFAVLQWMERMNSSTGAYDYAITQEILESMEFDYPNGYGNPPIADVPQQWACIDGGTEVVTDRMHTRMVKKPDYNHRVLAVTASPVVGGLPEMFVKVQGQPAFDATPYAHIVLTTPLGCVNQMDMTLAGPTYDQREAIRSLSYGSAVKIGIKFRTRWWQGIEQIGGVSYTDRAIRVVVYPSYGDLGLPDGSGVLIASYAWTQDAVRLGSNIQGNRTVVEQQLLDIVYNNLAAIHPENTAQWYREQTISHFSHDWSHDEFTTGAYAQFHPGQYNYTYGAMTKPAAAGYLHFSGEAISAHHAWIEGALVAAWRSVYQILWVEGRDDLLALFVAKWPPPDEIDPALEHWQVLRGVFDHDFELDAAAAAAAGG